MERSRETAGSVPNERSSSYNALTREKLFLLNLENNNMKNMKQHQEQRLSIINNPYNSYTTTPELSNSSSSSSLNSSESDQAISGHDHHFYKFYNNGSDSSIATVVQKKLSSTHSNSTLNLQNLDSHQEPVEKPQLEHDEMIVDVPVITASSTATTTDDDLSTTSEDQMTIPRSLKSSLKLPSLKRSKSLPSTKTVRFSTDLTKVKTFNEYAKPSSISLENSPDQSPPYYSNTNGRAYFDLKEDLFTNQSTPWFDQSSSSSEEEDDEEDNYFYKTPSSISQNKWKLKSMNFDLFRQSDPQSYVKLVSLNISKDSIVGLVQVLNISFEKQVEVKFTVDSWNSIYIVNASFDRSLNSSRDQFRFEINLNNSLLINSKRSKNQPINIELCVKYSSSNQAVFYDNNNGSNFKFQMVSNKQHRYSSNVKRSSQRPTYSTLPSVSSTAYDDNFASAILSSPDYYSSNENYTTSRYFPDNTDYFNTKFQGSNFQSTNNHSSIPSWSKNYASTSSSNTSSTVSSISSNISTTSNSSNETIKASNNNNESLNNLNAQSLEKSRQHYNEFLKKYCFFKSDDKKDHESIFIR